MSIPVSKTLAEVRGEVFARLAQVQEEYVAQGWLPRRINLNKGVVRGLVELFCWGLWKLYEFLALVLEQAFPRSSTDAWLNLHADQLDIARRPATKASGLVYFLRATGGAGNVKIPSGRIVRTLPDATGSVYRYVTTADAVLLEGFSDIAVPVEAEEYGRASNVTPGQICELSTFVPGIGSVENREDWLGEEGADEETDAQLHERYALAWLGNNGVTKYAYKSWALSVPGVIAVAVLDQHPRGQGTVDVVVKGSAGIPTDALVAKVEQAVAAHTPINDDWLVKAPVPVPVHIEAQLEFVSGEASSLLAQAEARIRAIFTDPALVEGIAPLQIGEDLTRDRLVGVLMAIPGIKRIIWTSPATDVAVPGNGLAVLESLTLTASEAVEP
jgi:uncharacterized phage protein gp47/JayE